MAIINYYERYGFSQIDELEKIQWIIDQKITDEENDPFGEGHSDKLFILQLAKDAFATAESRAKYDKDLADSMKKSDPDGERKASFEKWYADAANYYANKQYDLAKTAINRAMQYVSPQTVDSSFYNTATLIYLSLNLYQQALDLSNQSIVLSPDDASGYYLKAVTLYKYIKFRNDNERDVWRKNNEMWDIWRNLKATCELTINKVKAQGSGYDMASRCYEFLAEMHYYYVYNSVGHRDGMQFPLSVCNNTLAEVYALKAIEIINASSPDACPAAKAILDDISSRREKIAELERENAKLRPKIRKIEERIKRQQSSINNATKASDTLWYELIKRIGIGFGAFGLLYLFLPGGTEAALFFFIIAALALVISVPVISRNNKIRDTLESIREKQWNIGQIKNQISNNDREMNKQSEGFTAQTENLFASAEGM